MQPLSQNKMLLGFIFFFLVLFGLGFVHFVVCLFYSFLEIILIFVPKNKFCYVTNLMFKYVSSSSSLSPCFVADDILNSACALCPI